MQDFEWYRPLATGGRIRILAALGQNVGHWTPVDTRSGKLGVRRVPCSGDGCELCQDPSQTQHPRKDHSVLSMVIDRHDGKIKMFEIRGQIFSGLKDALRSSRIRNKDVSRFDIFITKSGRPPYARYGVALDRPKRLKVSEEAEARDVLASMVARLRPNCGL